VPGSTRFELSLNRDDRRGQAVAARAGGSTASLLSASPTLHYITLKSFTNTCKVAVTLGIDLPVACGVGETSAGQGA
jgi:hypothetical protein